MTIDNQEILLGRTLDALIDNTLSLGKLKGQIELFQTDVKNSHASLEKQRVMLDTLEDMSKQVSSTLLNDATIKTEIMRLSNIETTANSILDIVKSLGSNQAIKVETVKGKVMIITTSITTVGILIAGIITGIVKWM